MNLVPLIIALVKDDSTKLTNPGDYLAAETQALKRYSKHRPLEVPFDISGNGGHDYDLPSDWIDNLSMITQIEFPAGNVPELLLDRQDWKIYKTPTGGKLRIVTETPDASETIRITYTVLHTEDSVPAVDLEAVANLAASFCLRQLAAAYGQTGDSLIQADVVNYRSKADEFRRLADSYEKLYLDHLGIRPNETVSAASVSTLPADETRPRLTHSRRTGGRRWI